MKKILLTIVVAISTVAGFAGEGTDVSPKVLNAFKEEFRTAKEVVWSAGLDYYRATFSYNDKHVFAYYNIEGDLLAVTRYISPDDLPLSLQSDLKKTYGEYWISDLFEVANSDGTAYYVSIENAESKIVLKASDVNYWTRYNKTRKS
jgi:hypothetical protein